MSDRPSRRSLFGAGAALIAGAGALVTGVRPAVAGANPDAELIRLCARSVAIQAEICTIFATRGDSLEEEERTEPLVVALYHEHDEIEAALCEQPDPSTIEGYRAMARSALANAEKTRDGSLSAPAGFAEWLAFDLCRALTEGNAA